MIDVEDCEGISMEHDDDTRLYTVIINHEGQYSLWPKEKIIPNGWTSTGKEGLKPACIQYVDERWLDMRPLSLQRQMAATTERGE